MEKINFPGASQRKISDNANRLLYTQGVRESGEGKIVIGIDPGVNFGITLLNDMYVGVYHGSLKRETEPGRYGWRAFHLLKELALYNERIICIIEGAAYHKLNGQVGLAEIRQGFYISAMLLGYKTKIIPPASVRKHVFGNHLQQAMDIWPQLNHNAADSLSMALCGAML